MSTVLDHEDRDVSWGFLVFGETQLTLPVPTPRILKGIYHQTRFRPLCRNESRRPRQRSSLGTGPERLFDLKVGVVA